MLSLLAFVVVVVVVVVIVVLCVPDVCFVVFVLVVCGLSDERSPLREQHADPEATERGGVRLRQGSDDHGQDQDDEGEPQRREK